MPDQPPDGVSAWEWHKAKLGARAVENQLARDKRLDAREHESELRRRTQVTPVVSPLQKLVHAAVAKLRGGAPDDRQGDVSWWG